MAKHWDMVKSMNQLSGFMNHNKHNKYVEKKNMLAALNESVKL